MWGCLDGIRELSMARRSTLPVRWMPERQPWPADGWGWGVEYAVPCHHDDPSLPEIVDFAERLESYRRENPDSAQPVLLEPGETFELP